MHCESRTSKSVRNAKIALLFYFVNLILNFFSRKIFLDHLGSEVLGLNMTAQNLLGFLNLAELGIGSAISYMLYKPIFAKDMQTINEIVSVQGWLYRKIAFIVIGGATVLMLFFPWIFAKADIPLWYAYATFIVLLCSSVFSYFWNYRQIVLTADQKEYKIMINVQGFKFIKVLLQMGAILYLSHGYSWWLILEMLMAVLTVVVLNRLLRREYPWLNAQPFQGKQLRNKYPEIIEKTKQLFFHRVGGFVLQQTGPLIIYAYASLTLVTVYGNYMLIVSGVTMLLYAIFNSLGAGIGNLVAEGNKKHILKVFDELFVSRFLFASTICFGFYMLASPFVTLWIGEQYLLDDVSLALITAIMYINLMRSVVEGFINAYGLYQDVWATLTEAGLNLGGAITLGYFWGLHGILTGILISLFSIIFLWKPYFLYKKGICAPVNKYILTYLKLLIAGHTVWFVDGYFVHMIDFEPSSSYFHLLQYSAFSVGVFFLMMIPLLYYSCKGMRDFWERFAGILNKLIH